jgi:membrane associated rhomboid family serine protease
MQASNFFLKPEETPQGVKWLIWVTSVISLTSPLVTYFLERYAHMPGSGAWFALSRLGLEHGWVWQPITYFFLQTAGVGISLGLLVSLFFHMLLLWFAGSEIAARFTNRGLVLFYLGAGLAAGLVSTLFLFLFNSQTVLVGSGPPIYALVTLWAMLYPDLELFFFFVIRIKTKWLVAIYLGLSLLVNLSYGEIIPFIAATTSIAWALCVGQLIWKLKNPFPLNLDLAFKKKNSQNRDDKIIDITSFQEEDDAFMDRMLEKIAQFGESSLTSRERNRMQAISKRKRNN